MAANLKKTKGKKKDKRPLKTAGTTVKGGSSAAKTTKKPAAAKKSAAKKPAAKKFAAKRPATAKKPAAKRPVSAPIYEEQLSDSGMPTVRKPSGPEKPAGGMSLAMKILLFIILVVSIVIIVMFISPTCRDKVLNRFSPTDSPVGQQPAAIQTEVVNKSAGDIRKDRQKQAAEQEYDGEIYTVQVKDDLVKISEKKLGSSARWKEIYELNRDTMKYPNHLYPGQKLKIPAAK